MTILLKKKNRQEERKKITKTIIMVVCLKLNDKKITIKLHKNYKVIPPEMKNTKVLK